MTTDGREACNPIDEAFFAKSTQFTPSKHTGITGDIKIIMYHNQAWQMFEERRCFPFTKKIGKACKKTG